ncbi:MAG: hypothetical protein VX899_23875 [Myxococcota bacterium]|nr:hypothetical protein [Myxococcota bacterium]
MRSRLLALCLALAAGGAALLSVGSPAVQAADAADVHKTLLDSAGWTLVSTDSEDGLKVYKKHIASLGADAFMGEKVLDPGVDDQVLFGLISDVANHDRVTPNLHASESLSKTAAGEDYYQVAKAPKMLPVSERYWFNRAVNTINADGTVGHLRRSWQTIDASTYPTDLSHITTTWPDAVRIPFTYGMWEVVPNSSGPSSLVYRTVSDPGGEIPGWVMSSLTSRTLPDNMRTFERAALKVSQ